MDKTTTSSANETCPRCNCSKNLGGKILKPGECNVCVVAEEMSEAAGEVLVKNFPDAKYGDVSPLVSLVLMQAHEGLAKEWIGNNFPEEE